MEKEKRARPIVYVCVGIHDNNLLSKIVTATSVQEAEQNFSDTYGVKPKDILGPFYKVKTKVLESDRVLRFADNKPKKAIYKDWIVNAFLLSEPEDHAYLIFVKRIDDKKIPLPKGTITAPIYDLRMIDDK